MKRLKTPEEENASLSKPLAEAMLDKEAQQMAPGRKLSRQTRCGNPLKSCVRPPVCRNPVLAGWSLSTCRYSAQCPAADAQLSLCITELALERRCFGYQRIWQLLRREGLHVKYNLSR